MPAGGANRPRSALMSRQMPRGRHRHGIGRVALLPPAAYAVHQLRYLLAYGGRASTMLRATGHSYLHSVVPWLVALIALAVGSLLYRAGRACATRAAPRSRHVSFGALWALCALALITIFACQETLEGIFATGHPGGWSAVFGDGGWWAVPMAVVIGLVLAFAFRGASWAVRRAAAIRRPLALPRGAPPRGSPRPEPVFMLLSAPLLAGWCSRGPPAQRL
jgi:hypothetical protein